MIFIMIMMALIGLVVGIYQWSISSHDRPEKDMIKFSVRTKNKN